MWVMDVALAPLKLPSGRTLKIVGEENDLSVMQPLRLYEGVWEPHVRAVFERLVRPDWICLDGGANIGAHTLALAELCERVIAFEASSSNFAHLERNIAEFPNVLPINRALWHETGSVKLARSPDFAGGAYVGADGEEALSVRLDDWSKAYRLTRLDFIKLDVEGSEENVLLGARKTLRRFRPILLTEYNPTTAALLGAEPGDYYEKLRALYSAVKLIEPDGTLLHVYSWRAIAERLEAGKGWEDLLCVP
jgi:FkbM family methyltransferase